MVSLGNFLCTLGYILYNRTLISSGPLYNHCRQVLSQWQLQQSTAISSTFPYPFFKCHFPSLLSLTLHPFHIYILLIYDIYQPQGPLTKIWFSLFFLPILATFPPEKTSIIHNYDQKYLKKNSPSMILLYMSSGHLIWVWIFLRTIY